MLRAWARIRATVCSAAEITLDWGALTTMIPSRVAAATSTLSRPMPARPTTLRSRPVSSTSASTRVADRTTRASTPATALSSSSRVVRSSSTPASASGSAIRTRAMSSTLPLVPEPGHHPAQGLPGPLDRVVRPGLAHPGEVGPALVVLGDPLAGERAGLDLGKDAAHLGLGGVVDDPGAAAVVA